MKDSRQIYKFKKALDYLKSIKGRHTELVSVYIPQGYEISKVTQQIRDEIGTATNIKSTATRKNVLSALEKILQHLSLYNQTPENGLAIFCGNISQREGVSDIKIFPIEPIQPLTIRLYRCDQEFVLDPLYEMIEVKDVYGLLIIERNEATIGLLKGKKIEVADYLTSGVPGKTRAGGQSSVRFARLRDIADHEFRKRIGEHANRIFLDNENLVGIIVGGPGFTKEKFLKGNYLHHELQKKILGVLDISYNGEFGLRELVSKALDILQDLEMTREKELFKSFMMKLINNEPVAYGEKEIRHCLDVGAVDILLISEGLDLYRVKLKCDVCDYEEKKTLKRQDLQKLEEEISALQCPKCGNLKLVIPEKKELGDELSEKAQETSARVEMISTDTEEGNQLLKAFGGIAAILRFQVG